MMGEYFILVNLDKREYISPEDFGEGLKLREFAPGSGRTAMILTLLLAHEWAGDRIAVAGDSSHSRELYAETEFFVNIGPRVRETYREDLEEAREGDDYWPSKTRLLQKQLQEANATVAALSEDLVKRVVAAAGGQP